MKLKKTIQLKRMRNQCDSQKNVCGSTRSLTFLRLMCHCQLTHTQWDCNKLVTIFVHVIVHTHHFQ